MTTENRILDLGFAAAEDLSSCQFHFVVLDSGGVRLPNSADEIALGVLQNAPVAGEAAAVRVDGLTKMVCAAALALGDFVSPEYVSAADAGKAASAGTAWASTRGVVVEATDSEDQLAGVRLIGPFPQGGVLGTKMTTASTINTAGVETYTAAQLLGGLILRDPAGSGRSDVTPAASDIIAAIPQAGVGTSFEFTIRNTADASEAITVTAGSGVTISGTATIAQNNSKRFLAVVTGAAAVTIYSLGTTVH